MLKFMEIFQKYVGPAYLGDYWPLTPYSLDEDVWMAWQFDQPEEGKGIIEAFRRPQAADDTITVNPRALNPKKTYKITEVLTGETFTATGAEMMKGFKVKLDKAPEVAIYAYSLK